MSINMQDKINQVVLMIIVILLGGCYGFWEYVYVPKSAQLSSLKEQEDQLSRDLAKVKSQVQRMSKLREELAQDEAEFSRLQEMFPDQEQIPSRLQDLTSVTRRSGTTTTKFLPLPPVQREYYNENTYQLKITGSYHALGEMFAEMANFRYPTGVNKMSITTSPTLAKDMEDADLHGTTPSTIVAEFEFTTYTSRK